MVLGVARHKYRSRVEHPRPVLGEVQSLQNLRQGEMMMGHNLTEDGAQRAGTKRIIVRYREVMFAAGHRGESTVRPELPDKLVIECPSQRLFEFL